MSEELMMILEESINLCCLKCEASHLRHVKLFCHITVLTIDELTEIKKVFSAIIFASLKINGIKPAWPKSLEELTSYTVKDLVPLASKMILAYGQLLTDEEKKEGMDISS